MTYTNRTNDVTTDDITIARACEQYQELRERLPNAAIDEIDEVLAHLPVDPRTATVEQAWRVMWDKPLFANTKVATGWRWINELMPFMEDAWKVWGADADKFLITRTGRGRDAGSFEVVGVQAQQVRAVTRTAVHRLFAIQNAAMLLRSLADHAHTPVTPFWNTPLDTLVPDLVNKLGWGWGAVTVLHMLADFGVAGKPDIHVMRTLRHLGIWSGSKDQVNLKTALAVNHALHKIVLHTGERTPARLRRIDIELMALSRHGVIPS